MASLNSLAPEKSVTVFRREAVEVLGNAPRTGRVKTSSTPPPLLSCSAALAKAGAAFFCAASTRKPAIEIAGPHDCSCRKQNLLNAAKLDGVNSTNQNAPLLHFQRGDATLEETQSAAQRAAALGYGGFDVEVSGFDGASLRALATACREYSLALHLDVGDLMRIDDVLQNAVEVPRACSLYFETYEVFARDFPKWQVPPHTGELIGIVAVPLVGGSRAPQWENAIFLPPENDDVSQESDASTRDRGEIATPSSAETARADFVPLRDAAPPIASLEMLREVGEAARLFVMTMRDDVLASTRDDATQNTIFFRDALDERATRDCLAQKLQPLRESLGEAWSGVAGVTAAAPHSQRAQEIASPDSELRFAWSRGFAAAFEKLHGYEVLPRLPALIANTGDDAVRVRQDFHDAVARLTQENWWRVARDWARENGVAFAAAACESDAMPRALESSGGAVTALFNSRPPLAARPQSNGETDFLYARLAGSIAALRQLPPDENAPREYSHNENPSTEDEGKRAAAAVSSSENAVVSRDEENVPREYSRDFFALTARAEMWRESRYSMPLLMRRQQALSLLHAGVFSLEESAAQAALVAVGDASTRVAASVLAQPRAAAIAAFNRELAQFCGALQGSESGAQVGVLWPLRSLRAHYNPRGHRFTRWVEEDVCATAKLLDELHFNFLFLPEETLCAAPFSEIESAAALLCGEARLPLQLLIVPSVTTLSRAAWEKIEAFCERGGRVICLGLLPRWSEIGRDQELENRVLRATRFHVEDAYESYGATEKARTRGRVSPPVLVGGVGYPVAREYASGGRLCCYQPRLNGDEDDAFLVVRRMLMESLTPACETQERRVRVSHRVAQEGDLFFVVNGDEARRVNLRLHPTREGAPFLFDAARGAWKPLPVAMPFSQEEGGGLNLTLEMAAGEAQLIRIAPGEVPRAERATFHVETLDDFARGYATQSGVSQIALRDGDDGSARVTWRRAESVTLPPPLLLPDLWDARREAPNALHLAPSQGRVVFHLQEKLPHLWLALWRDDDASTRVALRLDEKKLVEIESPFPAHELWREKVWRWFDVTAARAGDNALEIEGETARLFLVGEFSMHEESGAENFLWPEDDFETPQIDASTLPSFSAEALPSLASPQPLQLKSGAWSEQGLPNYVGVGEYSQSVFAPREWETCRVFLEIASRENSVEVVVNGVPCGLHNAPPFRFEITEALRVGQENEIALRVFGDASPVLENAAPRCGLHGVARIVAFPRVEIAVGK